MAAQDFKLDTDGDLAIENGDFVIAESDKQHIKDIMNSVPGWFKKFPLVGFNPYQYLNARTNAQEIKNRAFTQLDADGYKVNPDGIQIEIDANGNVTGEIFDIVRK